MVKYRKLRDGSWGIAGPKDAVVPGASVSVQKADGTAKTETVGRIVAGPFPDGNVLASIARANAPAQAGRSTAKPKSSARRYECDECGDYVTPGTKCWETGAAH